jgi:hypothetical protein
MPRSARAIRAPTARRPAARARLRRAGLATLLALFGCAGPEPAPTPPVPEPTDPLRPPEQRGEVPLAAKLVDYVIDARLDTERHEIEGTARITWRNRTRRTVAELPLHLYMNGFRAADTAWMREARGAHRGNRLTGASPWGYIDVRSVRAVDPAGAASEGRGAVLAFAEGEDPSVGVVTLPAPVGPGEAVTLELEFLTKLPKIFARTGYHVDDDTDADSNAAKHGFHMGAQWYPKPGVLEEAEGWQAHVFTLNSEFYADFADFEVTLDVPAELVVGASGILVGEAREGDRKRLSYRAAMVHDFAWVADPRFVETWADHEGIRIRQLILPERIRDAPIHMEAQLRTLDSMQRRFGPYPWSTITIVHVPEGAEGAGGMEYPTLYTTSDMVDLAPIVRKHLLDERVSGVFTTVHEFGHQYFQGLFASNEHAQPWLDEGMNTTSNLLAYIDTYTKGGDAADPREGDPWMVRLRSHELRASDFVRTSLLGNSQAVDAVDQAADEYAELDGAYGAIVYQKTAAVMLTLRNLVGPEPWDRALARYAELARFAHPTGATLEQVLIDELGPRAGVGGGVQLDVRDYLEQTLRSATHLNMRVAEVGVRAALQPWGYHRGDGETGPGALEETPLPLLDEAKAADADAERGFPKVDDLDDAELESFVVVHRAGELRVPVELLVEFTDDSRERVVWDGQARTHTFTFPGKRLRFAQLDPAHKLWLEAQRLDNVAFVRAKDRGANLSGAVGDATEALTALVLAGVGG